MARAGLARFAIVTALTLPGASQAQAAGLFDSLARAIFGGPRLHATPIYEQDEPLRRPARRRPPEVAAKPKPAAVRLDPAADPDWHLKDPTLRRGDIVVTRRGILVYRGRSADAPAAGDFAALGGTPGDRGWKERLQAAAAGGRSFFRATAPGAAATASLGQPAPGPAEPAAR
ncbi:hypothetical protein [Bosea minatitlanensis]|uniref:Uncharacterized protein n=1 Tax=Bosea minatitlanensis TaxID=128782 RepID=A0ABW0F624_9HYPH|nr:hypothetical protein [Bosea minatitlanensis]MCT4493075.1 hypothetical protein [Bosea minatitlanensis]